MQSKVFKIVYKIILMLTKYFNKTLSITLIFLIKLLLKPKKNCKSLNTFDQTFPIKTRKLLKILRYLVTFQSKCNNHGKKL